LLNFEFIGFLLIDFLFLVDVEVLPELFLIEDGLDTALGHIQLPGDLVLHLLLLLDLLLDLLGDVFDLVLDFDSWELTWRVDYFFLAWVLVDCV